MTLAVRVEVSDRWQTTVVDLVLDQLSAPTSKSMYRRALLDFLDWYQASAAMVARSRTSCLARQLGPGRPSCAYLHTSAPSAEDEHRASLAALNRNESDHRGDL